MSRPASARMISNPATAPMAAGIWDGMGMSSRPATNWSSPLTRMALAVANSSSATTRESGHRVRRWPVPGEYSGAMGPSA